MNEKLPITVIINTYPRGTRKFDLSRLLESLTRQTYKNFTVLLVENSIDKRNIRTIIKQYSKVLRLFTLYDGTKRLSYLFNLGWQNSKTELLAYIADDTEADPNWLRNIYLELSRGGRVAAVSGPVISVTFPVGEMHRMYLITQQNLLVRWLTAPYYHFVMEDQPLAPGKYFQSGAYSMGTGLPEAVGFRRQDIDLLTTTSMGIRRSVIKSIGGFDERFLFNHADGDLFLRLKKKDYRLVFDPKIVVRHYLRIGPSRDPGIIGRDTAVFYKKHLRPRSLSGIIGAMMNVVILNSYWIYSALRNRSFAQLGGMAGFLQGLRE
jgi:GT2 family glycosyltransferase